MNEQEPPPLIPEYNIRSDIREKFSRPVIQRLRVRSAPIISALREIVRNEKKLPIGKIQKKLDDLSFHLATDTFQDEKELIVLIETIHKLLLLKLVKKKKYLPYVHYFASFMRMESKAYEKSLQDVCFSILRNKSEDETMLLSKTYAIRTLERYVVKYNNKTAERNLVQWVLNCVEKYHRKRFGKSRLKKMFKMDQLKKSQQIFFSTIMGFIGRNTSHFLTDLKIFQKMMNYMYILICRKEKFIARDAMYNIYRLVKGYIEKIPPMGKLTHNAFEPLILKIPEASIDDSPSAGDGSSKRQAESQKVGGRFCVLPSVIRENKNSAIMKTLNLHDEMAKVYFLRLAKYMLRISNSQTQQSSRLNVYASPSPKKRKKRRKDGMQNDESSSSSSVILFDSSQRRVIKFVKYLFHDSSTQVFVECINLYASFDPNVFECFLYQDIVYKNRNILSFVFQQLNYIHVDAFQRGEQALQYAIIQTIENLIEKLTTYLIQKYSLSTILHLSKKPTPPATELGLLPPEKEKLGRFLIEMGRLLEKMDYYKTSPHTHLRYMSYRVSLWSRNIEQLKSELQRLRSEIDSPNGCPWHGFQVLEILRTLLNYSHVYPDVFEHFTDFCEFLLTRHLDLLEPSLSSLIGLFQNAFSVLPDVSGTIGGGGKSSSSQKKVMDKRGKQFLNMLMNVLKDCKSEKFFYAMIIFLGEYANRITLHFGDPPKKKKRKKLPTEEEEEEEGEGQGGQVIPKEEERALPKNPSQSRMFGELELFRNFKIRNHAMKTITMLLFHTSLDNQPHVNLACSEGLLKIAIRSPGRLRFLIYNCLRFLRTRNERNLYGRCESLYQTCVNITLVLDEVYELKNFCTNILERKVLEKLSSEDEGEERKKRGRKIIHDFWVKHELIKEKLGCFVRFHLNFLPLGKESRKILKQGFIINQGIRLKNKKK